MAGFERNNVLSGVNLFITLMFLLLSQQHFLCAISTSHRFADIQEQSPQTDEIAKELVRYANLYRSSDKPFGDLSLLVSLFTDSRPRMPLRSVNDNVVASRVSKKADEQQQDNEQKLISWIRKYRLQPLMQEQRQGEDQYEALNRATEGHVGGEEKVTTTTKAVNHKSKRKMNCKPLKEQFMELQGEVKKGDNSFKNSLRDFFANCYRNDAIRF